MHETMLSDQQFLEKLSVYAEKTGLKARAFKTCIDSNKYTDAVKNDMELAMQLKVTAVPGFVIAAAEGTNSLKFKGISSIQGAVPFDVFKRSLDQALENVRK